MMHSVEADFWSRRFRERELYTIPVSSSWFRWDEIHEFERRSLPEFFDGGSYSRSPRVYKEYRDFIINKYREDPSRRLTFTDVRKSLVGDVGTLRKVFIFLEKWGLINFSASDGKKQHQQHLEDEGPMVMVEEGPVAGVRVVPAPSSSTSFTSTTQVGGEGLFKLPSLASYSDAFGEWKSSGNLLCGFCGGHHSSGLDLSLKGGITMCSKCSSKEDTGNEKPEVDSALNNHTDEKDTSFVTWTDAETLLLLEAVLKHGDDWDLIAQHVGTKNKLDCISRLIHLPFVFAEIDSDELVEINKTKGEEKDVQEHPLNQRCFPSFIDTAESFMKQVTSLSTVFGPHVATSAMDAAISALCQENPCARMAFEANEDKISKPASPSQGDKFKSDIKFEDDDAKINKHPDFVPEKDFEETSFKLRAAVAASLAAAAARAKHVADQEEREMELLMSSIIQAQFKKLRHKMKHLEELELTMEKELGHVQRAKEYAIEEWISVLKKLFHAGIPRWRDQVFPKTLFPSLPLQ